MYFLCFLIPFLGICFYVGRQKPYPRGPLEEWFIEEMNNPTTTNPTKKDYDGGYIDPPNFFD